MAKYFTQGKGVNFHEVFSPMVKHTFIRVILSIVAQMDLELDQMDVKTIFLYGDLEETIHTQKPEGFYIGYEE